jgi:hypothetical protein
MGVLNQLKTKGIFKLGGRGAYMVLSKLSLYTGISIVMCGRRESTSGFLDGFCAE